METRRTPLNELDKFMGGALQERVGRAVGEVTANIYDVNTKPDAVRKVSIQFVIKPSKSRREAAVTTKVTTALAPMTDLETTANIGIDDETGELVMVEQSDIANGQMNLLDDGVHENKVARFPVAK